MENNFQNENVIEVEFRDVIEAADYQNINKNNEALNNKAKLIELVTKALSFCKKLGNISFLKKWILDIPKLCDMLIDTINGVYKNTPYSSLVVVTLAILYAVCPFDILHDAIPIIGVLDDVAILKAVLNTIKNDLESYSSWKEIQDAV